jgi:hypothetical protein
VADNNIYNPDPVTYADWAKRLDPNGAIDAIVEILEEENPIVADAYVQEGNMTEGHQTTVRTGEPRSTWIGYNEGVLPVKSSTRQAFERPGHAASVWEMDKKLGKLNNNLAAFKMSESRPILSGMGKDLAETLIYGTLGEPKKFPGLQPRFDDTSAESAANIINGMPGGDPSTVAASTFTSLYAVTWGASQAFTFFPKGSKAGIEMLDEGEVTLFDANGGRYRGHRVFYDADMGFVLRDWESCGRVAQIPADPAASSILTSENAVNLPLLLTKLKYKLKRRAGGTTVFYCNEDLYTYFDLFVQQKSNIHFTMMDWQGEEVIGFRGIPIRVCDAITSTEQSVNGGDDSFVVDHGA